MEFSLEKKKHTIQIYGQNYEVLKPTLDQLTSFEERVKKAGDNASDSLCELKTFVTSLGVPEDVLGQLEAEHFTALIEYLAGKKKD